MSAIAAVLATGTRRPRPEDIERMVDPGRYPASLPPQTLIQDRCALGAAALPFTREEARDPQPVRLPGLVVAFAGRLDNRDELHKALGCAADLADARLAGLAYQRWGTECPGQLIGSFAVIVWDDGRQRLFCAVDHLATRSLFYAQLPDTFAVGSTIRQVRACDRVGDQLDEDYLLASVCMPAGAPLQSVRTPYAAIRRLVGGSALVVEPGRTARTWRYWRPEEIPESRAGFDELSEALRDRLEVAVRAQTRTSGKVMCTLSGGLDSSTITGLVARMAGSSTLPANGFEAASLVFGTGSEADEREFRRCAEQHYGVTALEIDGHGCWHFRDIGPGCPAPPVDEPFLSHAAYAETVQFAAAASKTNCNVVLYGHGGDELLSGSEYFLADLLRRGRLGTAWRRTRELAGQPNRTYASVLSGLAIGPIRAARSRRTGIQWDGPTNDWQSYWYRPPAPPWLITDERRRTAVAEIWREITTVGIRPYARAHEISWMRAASVSAVLNDYVFHPAGTDMRMPFYDRRVVELALSIPGELKLEVVDGARVRKRVLRAAARDILPEQIRNRQTKASLSVGSADGLRREWTRIWNDGHLEVAARGLVDRDLLSRSLRSARMGQWENIAHLAALVVLEFWLRDLNGQRTSEGR